MKNTATITRKGQTTIPAPLRRKLGLDVRGGVLDIRFDENRGELVISKPLSIDELSKKLTAYIKPGAKPLDDVDSYYQANREGYK
jgi:bifunctional DNA-binding transcriptional regulator/antitoxin component of YhaV-PrlF toxin-antitoxin module